MTACLRTLRRPSATLFERQVLVGAYDGSDDDAFRLGATNLHALEDHIKHVSVQFQFRTIFAVDRRSHSIQTNGVREGRRVLAAVGILV
jgi:hypothetical protein